MLRKVTLSLICFLAPIACFAKQAQSVSQASENTDAYQCFFIPPEGWEIADPKTLNPQVKISFLKRSPKGFCPSINLAIEETPVSQAEYLKTVKAFHERDRNNHWRALGKIRTGAGLAQLTEVDSTSEFGPIRILQIFLVKEGKAYILTAAALKEEMSQYYKDFQAAFRSLALTPDLVSSIPQLERRESLKERQHLLLQTAEQSVLLSTEKMNPLLDLDFQEKHWLPFQNFIINNFSDMGPFWQVLLLKNLQEKLLSLQPGEETDRQNS